MSLNKILIAKVFNNTYEYLAKPTISVGCAALGGKIFGNGPQMSLFQGAVSGIFCSSVLFPITKHILRYTYDDYSIYWINPEAGSFALLAVSIAGLVVPILLTKKYGESCLQAVSLYLPSRMKEMLSPSETETQKKVEYTFKHGLLTCLAIPRTYTFILPCLLSSLFLISKNIETIVKHNLRAYPFD